MNNQLASEKRERERERERGDRFGRKQPLHLKGACFEGEWFGRVQANRWIDWPGQVSKRADTFGTTITTVVWSVAADWSTGAGRGGVRE